MTDLIPSDINDRCKESFADMLKVIRASKNITLEGLSEEVVYSTSQLSRFEHNPPLVLPVKLSDVRNIANALGCTDEERSRLEKAYQCDVLRSKEIDVLYI